MRYTQRYIKALSEELYIRLSEEAEKKSEANLVKLYQSVHVDSKEKTLKFTGIAKRIAEVIEREIRNYVPVQKGDTSAFIQSIYGGRKKAPAIFAGDMADVVVDGMEDTFIALTIIHPPTRDYIERKIILHLEGGSVDVDRIEVLFKMLAEEAGIS